MSKNLCIQNSYAFVAVVVAQHRRMLASVRGVVVLVVHSASSYHPADGGGYELVRQSALNLRAPTRIKRARVMTTPFTLSIIDIEIGIVS